MKICILFSSYGPYHLARVSAFHSLVADSSLEVVGLELSRNQKEYPWKADINNQNFKISSVYDSIDLENIPIHQLIFNTIAKLNEIDPDIIAISGYSRPSMLFALLWAKIYRRKSILFSESSESDAKRQQFFEWIKQIILYFYDSALVGGKSHKQYLSKLGMPEKSIFLGYDVVDNTVFQPQRIKHLKRSISRPYILTVSRFVKKKNISFILDAYSDYQRALGSDAWSLVICGDGELRSEIEEKISTLDIPEYAHLTGFIQQDEILPYLAHAKCLLHASTYEQWGLVVNEAMAAGLPVIVSERCGCFEELVLEGVNGFGFDPCNVKQLKNILVKISSDDIDLEAMGKEGLKHIQKFSPEYFSRGLVGALEYSLAKD